MSRRLYSTQSPPSSSSPRSPLTVEAVNARLPLVERIIQDLRQQWHALLETRAELACLQDRTFRRNCDQNPTRVSRPLPSSPELQTAVARLSEQKQVREGALDDLELELHALGGTLVDAERGWVDFLSRRSGRLIFLCWRPGETSIAHYRDLASSSEERRPLGGGRAAIARTGLA